ncbi:MAG: phosphoglucosamine mutase, partial [Odoribacteraceae bacterium]|nr:phosphoglucosamine mutase [Odoribacteraceae bacterium]
QYASETITDIDGVKIDFESGWVHLRKSNTEPIIRVYSEAKDEQSADALAQQIITAAKRVIES